VRPKLQRSRVKVTKSSERCDERRNVVGKRRDDELRALSSATGLIAGWVEELDRARSS